MSTVSLETRQRFTDAEPSGTIAKSPVLVTPLPQGHAQAMPERLDAGLLRYTLNFFNLIRL
jgi:hypothetical protein